MTWRASTRPPTPLSSLVTALVAVALAGPVGAPAWAQQPTDTAEGPVPAFTHLRHVAETFRGTPEGRGLLATAVAEAEIAHQHATLALRDPTDVDAMVRHTRHVMHVLDPSTAEGGPGLGYGAIQAAERTAHYISLAAASDGATQAIETHSTHIETAARSAMASGGAALEVARQIVEAAQPPEPTDTTAAADTAAAADTSGAEEAEAADTTGTEAADTTGVEAEPTPEEPASPAEIEALVTELARLTDAMLNGVDADGDGRIGWQEGEGGLAQAARHLELLREAEGLGGR